MKAVINIRGEAGIYMAVGECNFDKRRFHDIAELTDSRVHDIE